MVCKCDPHKVGADVLEKGKHVCDGWPVDRKEETPEPEPDGPSYRETALAAIETAMIATCKIVGDDFKSNSNVVRALGCLVDAGEFLEGTHEDSK